MMSCTRTDKAVCAKYADKEEIDSLGDTLDAYDSAMIAYDKLDVDMRETMSEMGIGGKYKKFGIDSFLPMEALKDVHIKNGMLMKRDKYYYYSEISTIEWACDQVNRFVYSDKGWEKIRANNGIFANYRCRCAERDLDTIVNYVFIHFEK